MITAKYLILFFLFGVVLLIRIEKAYQLTLLLMIFTRLSFVDIGGDSILVCHVFTLLLLLRIFFSEKCYMKIRIPKQLTFFTVYMGISVFFALFHGDTYVINVDNQYAPVKFSMQQITQYAYLLHAVIFMAMTSDLLVKERIKTDDVWKALDMSYVLAIALGFLQLIIPIETFDFYFRDSMIGGASQTINGFHRIDSTFGEPSMLILFLSPLFCRYLYDLLCGRNTAKNLIFVFAGGAVALQNRSSSSVLGVLTAVMVMVLFQFLYGNRIQKRRLKTLWLVVLVFVFVLFLFRDNFRSIMDIFLLKIGGEGVSGSTRSAVAALHFRVFLENFLFGVGFGTLRSADLITGWLAQGGIVGISLYLGAVGSLCIRLLKQGTTEAKDLVIMIVSYNVIMMISVPEFMQIHIWVYYAMGQFLIFQNHKEG